VSTRAPDPAAHLARMIAVYGCSSPAEIAMVWAYLDETSVHEKVEGADKLQPVLMLVGGCLASQRKWEKFLPKWRKALRDEKVSAFHAKHFYAFRKEFEWHLPDGQRDWQRHGKFRDRLADIITEFTDEAIAFTSQIEITKTAKIKDVYKDAAVRAMHRLAFKSLYDQKPYVIFARHPDVSPWLLLRYFEQMSWDNRLRGCGIFDPLDVIQLQAADYVMHSVNRTWGGEAAKSHDRLVEGFRARGKQFLVQLQSSWSSSEILGERSS
jgi:hypothetical protein